MAAVPVRDRTDRDEYTGTHLERQSPHAQSIVDQLRSASTDRKLAADSAGVIRCPSA